MGSLTYLLGVALILGHWGRLDLQGLAEVVEPGPVAWFAAALIGAGLALKAALFPLHAWLTPVHENAWTPVSALHAALVIKRRCLYCCSCGAFCSPILSTPRVLSLG